jgi:hypothetical protein
MQIILAPVLGHNSGGFESPVLLHFRISILCRVVVSEGIGIAPNVIQALQFMAHIEEGLK